MSKKKKQKKKKHASGQERRQRAVRAAKIYVLGLINLAEACGINGLTQSLSKEAIRRLLVGRVDKIILEAADEKRPGNENIIALSAYLEDALKSTTEKISPDTEPVILYDIFTYGLTLLGALDKEFGLLPLIPESFHAPLKIISETIEKEGGSDEKLGKIYFTLSLLVSTIDQGYYRVSTEFMSVENKIPLIWVKVKLNFLTAENISVEIDGVKRSAWRVGWRFYTAKKEWAAIRASVIRPHAPSKDQLLPVYIQSHALQRLEERLDCIEERSILHFSVYQSIEEQKAHFTENGAILLEYFVAQTKLGYLLAEIIDNKVIIRTFLFITHDNTPEGRRLKELTGFSKIDKQYWAIDKLSTFISEEFRANEPLCQLFTKAGCGHLITLDFLGTNSYSGDHSFSDLAHFLDKHHQYATGIDY